MGDSVYGQHDAGWLSFYSFFHDVLSLTEQTKKLAGLWELAQSAEWALPHEHICWVSERHHILQRDEQGRLHSLTGPSVAYPDGWKIYAVHGVRVPEFIIERPHEITTQHIDNEKNAEVRRVMLDQYGIPRYLADTGAKPIHTDSFGTLYRKDIADDEPIVLVKVLNSTPELDGHYKPYFLRVDPELRPLHPDGTKGNPQELTARNAVASTFGMRGSEYALRKET